MTSYSIHRRATDCAPEAMAVTTMRRISSAVARLPWLTTALLISVLVACDDAMPPQSADVGSIRVTTATTGADVDLDGYQVALDDGTAATVPPNGNVTFSGVTPGSREILVGGVATNCTVGGGY